MITIFCTGTRLLVLDARLTGHGFNQRYFIERLMPLLSAQKPRNRREQPPIDLAVHMANSMRQSGRQITDSMQNETSRRAPHPVHSRDLSPYDFWLVGFLKERLKEQAIPIAEPTIKAITWDELQSVFGEWIPRLLWVSAHRGDYCNR
jgi:hypothetical protein